MTTLGVLVPTYPGAPPPPEERPIGRAVLALAHEGLDVVFGDELRDGVMTGLVARPGGWERASRRVAAVHDRFPSQIRAQHYARLLAGLDGAPLGNPTELTLLCRDKLQLQRFLEPLPMPEVVDEGLEETLVRWGAGFLKPRYGALGEGVRRVVPGDDLPAWIEGVVPGVAEPAILQRAVPPPTGWAGRSVRLLAQRDAGGWVLNEAVVRQSRTDPVVNARRGAEVVPSSDALSEGTRQQIEDLVRAGCAALSALGPTVLELGFDLVIDDEERPHLIEVNSRPRGRLEVLAGLDRARFGAMHAAACLRPLRYLASLV